MLKSRHRSIARIMAAGKPGVMLSAHTVAKVAGISPQWARTALKDLAAHGLVYYRQDVMSNGIERTLYRLTDAGMFFAVTGDIPLALPGLFEQLGGE
jgi:predicted ArsR family transcriptional regulator